MRRQVGERAGQIIHMPEGKQRKGKTMKGIVMPTKVLVMMPLSLGGCSWG